MALIQNFNPNTRKGNEYSFQLYLPNAEGTTIPTPPALTAPEVTERADRTNAKSVQGDFINLTTGDTVNFYWGHLGYDENGHVKPGPPSPVYAHSVVGATVVGFDVSPLKASIPEGVAGQYLIMQRQSVADNNQVDIVAKVVDMTQSESGEFSVYTAPKKLALSLEQMTELSTTLTAARLKTFPKVLISPVREIVKTIAEDETHLGPSIRRVTRYMESFTFNISNPGTDLAHIVQTAGGSYMVGANGKARGGEGLRGGDCRLKYWANFFSNAEGCGELESRLFVANLDSDTTSQTFDTAQMPVSIMLEYSILFTGQYPVIWATV